MAPHIILKRVANGFATLIQIALVIPAWLIGASYLAKCLGGVDAFGVATSLWLLLFLPAIFIHELGHYIAAKAVGMKVLNIQFPAIQVLPQRVGFRARWRLTSRLSGIGGYVIAFAHPERLGFFAPRLWYLLGGPLANTAVATVLGVAGWRSVPSGWAEFLLAFAIMNAFCGLANLVPREGKQSLTDGYQLVRLLWHAKNVPTHPLQRVLARSLFGCTAEQLPETDLVALEAQLFPMPVIALWFRLEACQIRGEWVQAALLQSRLDALLQDVPKAAAAVVSDLLALLRTELAFSAAMHEGHAGTITEGMLPPPSAWLSPHLWPRCLALRAAMTGERQACERWLAVSERYAENSVDESVRITERVLRAQVAATCGKEGATSVTTRQLFSATPSSAQATP